LQSAVKDEISESATFVAVLYHRLLEWFNRQLKDPWHLPKGSGGKFSNVDIYSRKIFPLSFAIINTIYWTSFMYYVSDEAPAREQTNIALT